MKGPRQSQAVSKAIHPTSEAPHHIPEQPGETHREGPARHPGASAREPGAVLAGSAPVTDGATCLLQRGDPGARRGASERVSQAGRGPAHPRPCWPPLPASQG